MTSVSLLSDKIAGSGALTGQPKALEVLNRTFRTPSEDFTSLAPAFFKKLEAEGQQTPDLVSFVLDTAYGVTPLEDRLNFLNRITTLAEEHVFPSMDLPLKDGSILHISQNEVIQASTKLLKNLHEVSGVLKRGYDSAILTGSLSYGRFFSTQQVQSRHPSDIDLFLIKSGRLQPDDLSIGQTPDKSRDIFLCDLFNEKGLLVNKHIDHKGVHFSLTVVPSAAFADITCLGSQPVDISLFRQRSFQGAPSILTDFSGEAFSEPMRECPHEDGHIMTLSNFSRGPHGRRLGGFGLMIMPSFETLHISPTDQARLSRYKTDLSSIIRSYRNQGMKAELCLAHPRRDRMSQFYQHQANKSLA